MINGPESASYYNSVYSQHARESLGNWLKPASLDLTLVSDSVAMKAELRICVFNKFRLSGVGCKVTVWGPRDPTGSSVVPFLHNFLFILGITCSHPFSCFYSLVQKPKVETVENQPLNTGLVTLTGTE